MNRVLKVINIAASIGIFILLGLIARNMIVSGYGPGEAPGVAPAERGVGTVAAVSFNSYSTVAEGGLFGPRVALRRLSVGGTRAVKAPSGPRGSVMLVGTVVGSEDGQSYAVFIERSSSSQDVFLKGDEVFSEGVLTAIYTDSAEITRGGRGELYYLPKDSDKVPAIKGARRPRIKPGPGADVKRGARIGRGDVKQTGVNDWEIDERALNAALENMDTILTDVRMTPYSREGEVIGFKLSQVKRDGVFAMMGLRHGDILMKVNDFNVDSVENGMQLLMGLRGETSISLDILRGGASQRLTYSIR